MIPGVFIHQSQPLTLARKEHIEFTEIASWHFRKNRNLLSVGREVHMFTGGGSPWSAGVYNLNFYPVKVVSCYREPQLQLDKKYIRMR